MTTTMMMTTLRTKKPLNSLKTVSCHPSFRVLSKPQKTLAQLPANESHGGGKEANGPLL